MLDHPSGPVMDGIPPDESSIGTVDIVSFNVCLSLDDPVPCSFDKPAIPHLKLIILDFSDDKNIHIGILQAQLTDPVPTGERKIRRRFLDPCRMEAEIPVLSDKCPGHMLGNILVGDKGVRLSPPNHAFDPCPLGYHPVIFEGDEPEIQ